MRLVFTLASCLLLLSACSSSKTKPHLVDSSEIYRQNNPLFAGVIDQVKSFPVSGQINSDLQSDQDGFLNDGKPFGALKVVAQGNAFTNGFLGSPKACFVEIRNKRGEAPKDRGSSIFSQTGSGVYTAIVPVTCVDLVSFRFAVPCLKEGSSDYSVLVGPDDGSVPAIEYRHPCMIMPKMKSILNMIKTVFEPERSSRRSMPAEVPTTPASADSAPKTQYEIQQQMLKQQQEQDAANKDE